MPDTTVTRSFRLDEASLKVIERDAERLGVSVNTLVNQLLTKYARADRFLTSVGVLQIMDGRILKDVFAAIPDSQLAEIGKKHGKDLGVHNLVLAITGGSSAANIIQFLKTMGDINGLNYTEIDDGRKKTFTIVHNLGRQFSIFISSFVSSALDKAGTWPKVTLDDQTVVFEYEM